MFVLFVSLHSFEIWFDSGIWNAIINGRCCSSKSIGNSQQQKLNYNCFSHLATTKIYNFCILSSSGQNIYLLFCFSLPLYTRDQTFQPCISSLSSIILFYCVENELSELSVMTSFLLMCSMNFNKVCR